MKIKAELYHKALDGGTVEWYKRKYLDPECNTLYEWKCTESKSDSFDAMLSRTSHDNGETWSEWTVNSDEGDKSRNQGAHVMETIDQESAYNPVHRHFVKLSYQAIHIDGYRAASNKYWEEANVWGRPVHGFVTVSKDGKDESIRQIKYEDGADFDPDNWLIPEYIYRNYCVPVGNIVVLDDGDILTPVSVPIRKCCEMRGLDVNDIYPSRPDGEHGTIVLRGHFDGENYTFTPGRPVVISDVMSSRGIDEPILIRLENGRLVLINRGSNVRFNDGKDRIAPGTPGVKWYCVSDDGGKTFSDLMPWHYDDGEIIYSPSSYARVFTDKNTGKNYFIGNITDHHIDGNFPRSTLAIVEIDKNYGTAKKDTLTIIDERHEGEPYKIQLSNFGYFQNNETGNLEIDLTKIGQFYDDKDPSTTPFKGEAWRYEITLD